MAAFNAFHQATEDFAHGVHDLGSDTIKVALTNTEPSQSTDAVFGDITEISAGNGYTAGGETATVTSSGQSGGTYTLVLEDVEFTASGGSIGPFRYVVLYNDTPSSPNKPLLGYWDHGQEVTLGDGEKFTVDFDPTDGALQLQLP